MKNSEKNISDMTNLADDNKVMKAQVKDLNFYYGENKVVKNVNLTIYQNKVLALIGPSGCGKSTLLRCFNRMHELYVGNRYEGEIRLYPGGKNILDKKVDPIEVRMKMGMVFQKPNPFPKSIFENVAYGLRIRGVTDKNVINQKVEDSLRSSALWEEVKDRLNGEAMQLSGGQQQRLCIARTLAVDPEVILFDEPTSALDPTSTAKIEELVTQLKSRVSIIIVTHNMQQASRVSDTTAFMYLGEMVEVGETGEIFTNPKVKLTEDYISGHFG